MTTFREFTNRVEEIINSIQQMKKEDDLSRKHSTVAASQDHITRISLIPVRIIDLLTDDARADITYLIYSAIKADFSVWTQLSGHVLKLWDQPLGTPAKQLGKELLNLTSAFVMQELKSPFMLSYSGYLAKSAVFAYARANPRVVLCKKSYGPSSFSLAYKNVAQDYATEFNNNREKVR